MKRIAIVRDGIVDTIALWDGVRPWDPNGTSICIDVTDHVPAVGPVYMCARSFGNYVFSAPPVEEVVE